MADNAMVIRKKSVLAELMRKVPKTINSGGVMMARAYKAWTARATKAMNTPSAKTDESELNRLISEYATFERGDWAPPTPPPEGGLR